MTVPTATATSNGHAVPEESILYERPKDVGILAMEMYFPARVRVIRLFSAQSAECDIFLVTSAVYL